ncbi:hypothetical protein MMC25_005722 [Agyrium rufum]|nr:hypothetical protein [Agyrium rufum]
MITEVVTFPLKDDLSSVGLESQFSRTMEQTIAGLLKAQNVHSIYYGRFVEKPDIAVILILWNASHQYTNFEQSSEHKTYIQALQDLAKDPKSITSLHVVSKNAADPSQALQASSEVGTTEIGFFYFPTKQSPEDRDSITASVDKFRPCVERSVCHAIYDGWASEDDVINPSASGEDAKCKAYVIAAGWPSIDAHMQFQGSDDFHQHVPHLLGMKGLRHFELFHVTLKAV